MTYCHCINIEPQSYDNQVVMEPPFTSLDCLGEKKSNRVCIDTCLATEIGWLWHQGVVTNGCCCGHGDESCAYIGVEAESVEAMKSLGYKQFHNPKHPPVSPEQHFIPNYPSLFMKTSLSQERIEELKSMSQRIRIGEHAFAEEVGGTPAIEVLHDSLVEVLSSIDSSSKT